MSVSATSTATTKARRELPGDLAIWIFILAELAVFGILFIAFSATRATYPEMFLEGFHHLNRTAGLINTIALITSSYFVVNAVVSVRRDQLKHAALWLWAALGAGAVYVIVKCVEYADSFTAGYKLSTNTFYMFYYFLTFFHLAHVLLGMVILGALLVNCYKGKYSSKDHYGMSSGASYWHMVDLVWVVLFPTVYVIH